MSSRGLFDSPAGAVGDGGSALATLEGLLERVTFCNEENGWSVVRLQVPGRAELVTAVGTLAGVQPGESVRLTGRWVNDRRFGEQFRVESFISVQPSTLVGMERYLGSGMVRGIGKVMAARLVKQFGFGTLEVIEQQPSRLTEVEGIGPKRKARIVEAWAEQKGIKEVMLFLQSHGVSPTLAVRIYRQYRDRSISIVTENPYRLAADIFGIGFKTADKIAEGLGIPRDSPRRAEAGLLHVLSELADEGHLYCPRDMLLDQAESILTIDRVIVEAALDRLQAEAAVVVEATVEGQPIYLSALHACERGAAERLALLLGVPAAPIRIDVERALLWFEEVQKLELAREQREAIRRAIDRKVLVLTGGPGTGKTTIVNGILRILIKKGRRIRLAAPTGRAAKRLAEATGQEATTIHRLLEFDPRGKHFERNQDRPLEADLVILDEMSMADMVLFYNVVKALPPEAQLILVGDVDQLPSVGAGRVLQDIILSGVVPVVRLTEIFRQARESLIVVNAHRVNRGEPPDMGQAPSAAGGGREPDFYMIEREEPEAILSTIKELVARRVPDHFRVDPVEDIQVLTPMHRGLLGSTQLNTDLQALLNPQGEALQRGSRLFRVGDKVMQTRNNYDLDVFNGDLGRIIAIDEEERQLKVRVDDRVVTYEPADLDELVLGYACSVHKAQGSEYPVVILPLHTQHYPMLQRNLLYTAITRARRLCILVGSRRALSLAVRNQRTVARFSRLAERLREAITARGGNAVPL